MTTKKQPDYDELVMIGDNAIGPHDHNVYPIAVAEWLAEEAREVKNDPSSSNFVDSLFDAMGILLLGLSIAPRSELEKGFASYLESQRTRGRPPAWWHHAIEKVVADFLAHTADTDAEEDRWHTARRALAAKIGKMKLKNADLTSWGVAAKES